VLAIAEEDGQCYCMLHGDLDEAAQRLPDTIQGVVLGVCPRISVSGSVHPGLTCRFACPDGAGF
jgi:hypothetical protein